MADIAKPSPPELKNLKPALPDVWDLAKLEASVNSTSQRAVTQWLAYLSLWAYLFFTTLSITHRDLILLTPVKLPLIGVELGLRGYFWSAPPLFWVFHLYLVRKITVLARDVAFYRDVIRRFVPSETAREPLYRRLDAFFLTRLLGHGEQGWLLRWLDSGIAVATVVVMPLALMMAFQLKYLAYHAVWATDWHRFWLLADVLLLAVPLLWLLWRRPRGANDVEGKKRPSRAWLQGWGVAVGQTLGIALVFGGIAAFSLLVVTYPDDRMDWALSVVGLSDEDHPLSSWRVLTPLDTDFVNDEKLDKVQWTVDLRGRDLRGAQLSGADLRKARMTGVDLRDANISDSQLDGADISNSNIKNASMQNSKLKSSNISNSYIKDANISYSQLQGANIKNTRIISSDLSNSNLNGADISDSNIIDSDIEKSYMRGSDLSNAFIFRSNIRNSKIQGSYMRKTKFSLVTIENSDLQGADISDSQIEAVNVSGANFWRVTHNRATSFDHVDHREQIRYIRGDDVNDRSIAVWIGDVPVGVEQDRMIERMVILREERKPDEDAESERAFRDAFGAPPLTLREDLTRYLDRLVCKEVGDAVHRVIGGRVGNRESTIDHVALAKRFLDPTCLGEKHLKDYERDRLRKIISNSESPAP